MLPVCSVQSKEIIAFRYEIFCFPFRVSFQPFFILPLWMWTNAGDFICHKMDVTLNFLLQLQLALSLFPLENFISLFNFFVSFFLVSICFATTKSLFFLYFIIRAKRRKFNQFKCYFFTPVGRSTGCLFQKCPRKVKLALDCLLYSKGTETPDTL